MMSVSYDTILHKISKEVQLAQTHQTNDKRFKRHITHIHLLCDLILEENREEHMSERKETTQPSSQPKQLAPTHLNLQGTPLKDDDGANGDSIFDF